MGETISEWMSKENLVCWNEPSTPTRIISNSSPDIAITNSSTNVSSWCTLGTIRSDHSPMMLTLNTSSKNQDYTQVKKAGFDWSQADWTSYRNELEEASARIDKIKIKEKKAKVFRNEILKAKNKYIPRVFLRLRKAQKWWNSEVMEQLREFERTQSEKLDDNDLSDENLSLLKKLNNEICEAVKTCREKDIKKKIQECVSEEGLLNESGILKYMNDVRKLDGRVIKNEIPFLHNKDMEKVFGDKERADLFTDTFSEVVCKEIKYEYRKNFKRERINEILPFTQDEVARQLSRMHGLKTSPDGINAILLQQLGEKMFKVLVNILNDSWKNMVVPTNWKSTYWVPLVKPGKDPHDPLSYRMIALTPAIAKLMEKIVKERLMFLIEKSDNSIGNLSMYQAAYRKTRSCREQIIFLTDILKEKRLRGETSAVVFMDIKKAFDSVNPEKLFERMRKMRIPENYIRWVESFLHNRTAATIVNGCASKYVKLTRGVPQGTVLASLLFILYIDELTEIIAKKVRLSLFADDIAFVVSGKKGNEIEKITQDAFTSAENFLVNCDLVLSREKTKLMLIHPKGQKYRHYIEVLYKDGMRISGTKSEKFLGVIIDENLTFAEHAKNICRRVNKKLRFLSMLSDERWGCTKKIIRQIYIIYILPILTYAIESVYYFIVSNAPVYSKLNTMHLKAAKIITGADFGTHSDEVLKESCLPDFKNFCLVETARWAAKVERLRFAPCKARLTATKRECKFKNLKVLCYAYETYKNINLLDLPVEHYPPYFFPPWKDYADVKFNESLKVKKSANKEENRKICEEEILKIRRQYDNNILLTLYTDGAVVDGAGGCAFYTEYKNERIEMKFPAGGICTSFRAELRAIRHALHYAVKNLTGDGIEGRAILIFTDSQSAIMELKRGACQQRTYLGLVCWRIIDQLCERGLKIHMVHIFSHCGIQGNERADALATEATELEQKGVSIDYKTATTKMKYYLTNVRPGIKEKFPVNDFDRRKEIIISQVRMNKAPFTIKMTGNKYKNGYCPCCMTEDTVQHFVRLCPAFKKIRMEHFGKEFLTQLDLTNMTGDLNLMGKLTDFLDSIKEPKLLRSWYSKKIR
eukprot:TRINITY_DN4466_c0_g1_i11.p1 TRINITY_DN4466_c0_g1~~TRINITY_DN4466_c0_g1_i11.p1  ORF type:complete len:1097 (+),score=72.08 TRINITY_DN4466_c0_g1_i11:614-3904(+)